MIPPVQFLAPKEEILMKCFSLFALVFILAACGGEAYVEQTVIGGFCETITDCTCPDGYESSCEDEQCLCFKTEIVESGCQVDEDCECGIGSSPVPLSGTGGGISKYILYIKLYI